MAKHKSYLLHIPMNRKTSPFRINSSHISSSFLTFIPPKRKTMISQAILLTVMMLMDTGRCWQPKPMSTCLTRCEDLTVPFPFGIASFCNLDSSFLVTCNHSYKPPKPFLNLGINILLDGKFIVVSSLASKFYDYTSLQINNSISEVALPESPRFEGVGKKDDSCCYPQRGASRSILFCIYLGFMVPAVGVSWMIWRRKKHKVVKLRRSLFVRNGGELLEAQQPLQKTLSVFTAEDLKKATNNYNEINVLSREHHLGIAYKGILPGVNCSVTIQFCHAFDQCKIEVLITKLVALSQISHRNVVKLLGCCLETQIPLMVYEFITCKTLSDHINGDCLSWDIRLRIAADTAGALAYMHLATTTKAPIIHGSLNSTSILLDHGYTVKLKGFASTCSECSCVQFYGQLTEKSDVYSFGIILVELLTGKGVMCPEWLKQEENLASGSSTEGDLLGILDDRIVTNDNVGKLRKVAEIAKICLSSSSHDRPTMEEVAIAIECIILSYLLKHTNMWVLS